MKKVLVVSIVLFVFIAGCDSLRFAPSEAQKQNAYLHNRTAIMAAETAKDEGSSNKLQNLTKLGELQSRSFVAYCGLPKELPSAATAEDVLSESSVGITNNAILDSGQRPDVWSLADSGLELAIGIAGLFGGVYGTKAIGFLRQAKTKSQALKEIIEGNELFKKLNADKVEQFKQSQEGQSVETRKIVTELKS
jgi:hypothetical protein